MLAIVIAPTMALLLPWWTLHAAAAATGRGALRRQRLQFRTHAHTHMQGRGANHSECAGSGIK